MHRARRGPERVERSPGIGSFRREPLLHSWREEAGRGRYNAARMLEGVWLRRDRRGHVLRSGRSLRADVLWNATNFTGTNGWMGRGAENRWDQANR